MPKIGTSGLMSGERRRIAVATPRLSSTLQHERDLAATAAVMGHVWDTCDAFTVCLTDFAAHASDECRLPVMRVYQGVRQHTEEQPW